LAPTPEERASLRDERERLRHLESLRAAAGGAAEAIAPEASEGSGAALLLAQAESLAAGASGIDGELDALGSRLAALRIEADELAADLRSYEAGLEGEPGRLEQVEERLEAYDRLERKHGGSVEAVLAHLERCRSERERLENAHVVLERAQGALAEAEASERSLAAKVSRGREKAAPELERRVLAELRELAMEDASFEVRLEEREALKTSGAERVEFLIAPNPGVPAAPLRESASGGELSRVMLALMGVAAAGGGPTLVFDEVDAGIGGQTARAVGERLRSLGEGRQVLTITHLPQIASLAERHFRIAKDTGEALARTHVAALEGDAVVGELVRMLGADAADAGARKHAEELLAAA
ncbi:MAG: DNA repair protein RecN, partial [Thermoleophilaceae bacterium]|nr:DNA repair protein RecN [Thermoleophilaceae bacterium]